MEQSAGEDSWHQGRKGRAYYWPVGSDRIRVTYAARKVKGDDDLHYVFGRALPRLPELGPNGTFRVRAYNTFLLPDPSRFFKSNPHLTAAEDLPRKVRARAMAKLLGGFDVLILSEVFDDHARSLLAAELRHQGYPYVTKVIDEGDLEQDGGVIIASRWEIVRERQIIYRQASGWDSVANKGAKYVCVASPFGRVHVFGTHTQADADEAGVRRQQFGALRRFIDAQDIPASEPVIIGGDLNVDRLSAPGEYSGMLDALAARDPWSDVGGPEGTYSSEESPLADESGTQHLDYILYARDHIRPAGMSTAVDWLRTAKPWTDEVERILRYRREEMGFPASAPRNLDFPELSDLSDHAAVSVTFDFFDDPEGGGADGPQAFGASGDDEKDQQVSLLGEGMLGASSPLPEDGARSPVHPEPSGWGR